MTSSNRTSGSNYPIAPRTISEVTEKTQLLMKLTYTRDHSFLQQLEKDNVTQSIEVLAADILLTLRGF